ncbi:MAG: glycosyl hydrolase, partial [Blautia sp.]|nr:glycosyl hydrolase [Blautia sp.]
MSFLTADQKKRVDDLLAKMTLEEKIGQMNQESPSIVGGFDVPFGELIEMMTDGRISKEEFGKIMSESTQDYHEDAIRRGEVGSLMVQDPVKVNELQRIAVEETRLGIPLIFGLDVIHGFRSVYPIAIAEAGSFDTDLMERTAHMAAKESRTAGVSWHFAPMLDIARDARWGRVSEGPGEDPYLASSFARAKIRGLQSDTSSPENYVAACLKHYVGYGACEAGRDYNTVSMAMHVFYNNYLKPFEAAVEEGAATVMAAFNDLNGVPCTVNSFLLRDMLKNSMGFPGFVVSDANAIKECVNHGIAADDMDAGIQAALAGMDMDMGTEIYVKNLKQAVEDGKVPMAVIDEAARRILSVKMWLGLFDHPYVTEEAMKRYEVLPAEHIDLCREAGEK